MRQWKEAALGMLSSLNSGKRFFTEQVVRHWKRLPGEVLTAPSLTAFKEGLHNALSHTV